MTPLQKYLEKKRKSGVKLDPDSFGLFIDEFLHENDVEMLVKLPAGHEEPEIIDNIGAGPVLTFYLLLSCLAPVFHDLLKFWARGRRRTRKSSRIRCWSSCARTCCAKRKRMIKAMGG